MNYSLNAQPHLCNKKQLSALFGAVIFHIFIFITYFFHSAYNQSLLNLTPQTISVSLVAKSSLNRNSQSRFHNNSKLDKSLQDTANSSTQSTSGLTSQNSKLINSAIVEPVFDAKQLNNPSPVYPEIAKARGIEGTVVLKVLVSNKGNALNIEINKSSGSSILDLSALETVKSWHFIPATQNSQNIDSYVLVPIVFKII